jgi:hypothetical protein
VGLPWVRLDTQFASNPKVVELVADKKWRAAFAYVASLTYAGAHGTDGFIPENCLFLIHATRAEANALVAVGLWKMAPGGWDINGWDEFQVSDEAARKRRERAQKGGVAKAQRAAEKALRSVQ